MNETEPISFIEAKRRKDLDLAKKALSFHRHWAGFFEGEVARLDLGMIPIRNGLRIEDEDPDLPPAS
jgi:hypothetical protein